MPIDTYIIRRAPSAVSEALLTDRSFAQEVSIPVTTTLHLGDTFKVDAEDFVGALRKILAGKATAKVKPVSGHPIIFNGKLDSNGTVVLSSTGISLRDEAAAILAPHKKLPDQGR